MVQLTSVLKSVADVSKSAGNAAVQVLDTGATVTATASTIFVEITASTWGAAQAAWRGVDLTNVTIAATMGRVVAADESDLIDWINGASTAELTKALPEQLELWKGVVGGMSLSLPVQEHFQETFVEGHALQRTEAQATILNSGQFAFTYHVQHVTFVPQWSNPLWQLLELNITAEAAQMQRTAASLLNSTARAKPAFELTTLNYVGIRPWFKLRMRYFYTLLRRCLWEISSLWGGGSCAMLGWTTYHFGNSWCKAIWAFNMWIAGGLGTIYCHSCHWMGRAYFAIRNAKDLSRKMSNRACKFFQDLVEKGTQSFAAAANIWEIVQMPADGS